MHITHTYVRVLTISLILHKTLDLLRSAQVLLYVASQLLLCCFRLQVYMAWQAGAMTTNKCCTWLNLLKEQCLILPQMSKTYICTTCVVVFQTTTNPNPNPNPNPTLLLLQLWHNFNGKVGSGMLHGESVYLSQHYHPTQH